jgi:hypothetical protein
MLLVPTALAGVLAIARLARSKRIESFEHLSSNYDKPSTGSQLSTLASITLALCQLLMYGAFINRFAQAGSELTTPWFNTSVIAQFANYWVTVLGDYAKLFAFATELDMPSNLRSLVVISKATTPSVALGTVFKHISTAWLLRAMCVRSPEKQPILKDFVVFYDAFEIVSVLYASLTIVESILDETRVIAIDDRYLLFSSPGKIRTSAYVLHSLVAACCMGFGVAHIYTMERVTLGFVPPEFEPFVPPGPDAAREFFFGDIDRVSGCTLASSLMSWLLFFILITRRNRPVDKLFKRVARLCVMFNLLQQFFNSLLLGMTLAAQNIFETLNHDMTPWWDKMQVVSIASFGMTTITQIHFQMRFMPEVD